MVLGHNPSTQENARRASLIEVMLCYTEFQGSPGYRERPYLIKKVYIFFFIESDMILPYTYIVMNKLE